MAAPAEPRTPNLHRANRIAPRECEWKHGDSGHSAGEKSCLTKKQKNRLDSDRPSHGRRLHVSTLRERFCNNQHWVAKYAVFIRLQSLSKAYPICLHQLSLGKLELGALGPKTL